MPFEPGKSGSPKNQFSKDNQPENPGRPRKLISVINAELKAEGYEVATSVHIMDAYQTLINLPMAKIAAIANKEILYKRKKFPENPLSEEMEIVYLEEGDNYPMLYRLVARELIGKRGGEYLERILDRAYGKASQPIQLSDPDGNAIQPIININVINPNLEDQKKEVS